MQLFDDVFDALFPRPCQSYAAPDLERREEQGNAARQEEVLAGSRFTLVEAVGHRPPSLLDQDCPRNANATRFGWTAEVRYASKIGLL
jgi:hypothetical protein